LVLFAHLDRADVFVQLSKKSEATKAYSAQLESLQLAEADYEAALKQAQQFGYATLYPTIEGFLQRLGFRRQMAENNARFSKVLEKSSVFAPKKPSDVLVNEQFVPDRVDLPPGLTALAQKEHLLEGGDARSLVTRGQFHAAAGEADQALADYLKA